MKSSMGRACGCRADGRKCCPPTLSYRQLQPQRQRHTLKVELQLDLRRSMWLQWRAVTYCPNSWTWTTPLPCRTDDGDCERRGCYGPRTGTLFSSDARRQATFLNCQCRPQSDSRCHGCPTPSCRAGAAAVSVSRWTNKPKRTRRAIPGALPAGSPLCNVVQICEVLNPFQ